MSLNWELILEYAFSYGGWVIGIVISIIELREAKDTQRKQDLMLEEIRKLKAQNVLLQLKMDLSDDIISADELSFLERRIKGIADTEVPK